MLVVGGGIGGLSTALALSSRGRPVHVIEKAPEFGEIGAGIQLAPNALHVLAELGVLDRALQDVVYPECALLMDALTGERIAELDFGSEFRRRYGQPYVVTHRGDLLAALVEGCQARSDLITLETGKTAIDVTIVDGRGRVECADGSVYEAPLVVGADGLWSVVRGFVLRDGPPRCTGDVAYRGAVPIDLVPNASAERATMTWWIGPKMHLVQYPVRRGNLFNQVGVFTSDRFDSEADPMSRDWGTPGELDLRFDRMIERVRTSASLLNRDVRWPLFDRRPATTWTRGPITLVGDAAHPMLQYLAQGGCQALEDAAALGRGIQLHDNDLGAAIAYYERERIERASKAQLWARRVGEIVHGDGLLALLRNALLSSLPPTDFRYVDWLYAGGSRRDSVVVPGLTVPAPSTSRA
ncbi:3-hydroxybenzoate 6-monooxygenase [Dactylosporangium fulvum]|uniref:FAD-dependent oxidoreductase n=1 Tax=Dactylosporangium fulvum TaxID=53359 RepID=A0ABY5VSR4_9ACTN|nr:FAD-dependent monooxygenase [Dactylosporangium fulvum]UWP80247.1 FAD-dependent oxidoreductase [Dactylosporangium fulvum]